MADAVELKLTGLDGVLRTLQSLPAEVVSKNGGPVRRALRKGALVILNEAKSNLRAAIALPGKTGITESTGFTEKNIIAKRKAPRGGENGERYIITVNPKVHPNAAEIKRASRAKPGSKRKSRGGPKSRPIKANDIAFIMEYGSSKQEATPWLRPAFASKAEEAIRTVEKELVAGIDRIVKKLARQNRR